MPNAVLGAGERVSKIRFLFPWSLSSLGGTHIINKQAKKRMSEKDNFQLYLVLIKLNKLYLVLPFFLKGSEG